MKFEALSYEAQKETWDRYYADVKKTVRERTGPVFTEQEIRKIFLSYMYELDFLEDGRKASDVKK